MKNKSYHGGMSSATKKPESNDSGFLRGICDTYFSYAGTLVSHPSGAGALPICMLLYIS